MSIVQEIAKELRFLPQDLKASVVAGELVDNGLNIEKLAFRNISIFRRFVSREIEQVRVEQKDSENEYLQLDVNKEGLYDMLPEALFHEAKKREPEQSDEQQIKAQKLQEQSARTFFRPLENEFSRRLLLFDLAERELHKQSNPVKNRQFFEYFFGDASLLSDAQILTLTYILPLSSKIRSNLSLMGLTLSRVLNFNVAVTKEMTCERRATVGKLSARLGAGHLGVNSTIGHVCVDYRYTYEIHVKEVSAHDYPLFCEGGDHENVIRFISSYFFPAIAEVKVSLYPTTEDSCLKTFTSESVSFWDLIPIFKRL